MHHLRFVLTLLVTCLTTITAAPLSAPEAILRGTVTDSATGGPVAGATVSVVGTDRRTETNADGEYRLGDLARGAGHPGAADRVRPAKRTVEVGEARPLPTSS